jgi:hypothetical protein
MIFGMICIGGISYLSGILLSAQASLTLAGGSPGPYLSTAQASVSMPPQFFSGRVEQKRFEFRIGERADIG